MFLEIAKTGAPYRQVRTGPAAADHTAERPPDKERPMFDALDELEARDEDPSDAKGKYVKYGIGFAVMLLVFAVLALAMWQYHG